jgi:DNA-binding IscR family transcriptional regulator
MASWCGQGGGYRLARPAAEIKLLEIVEAMDGPVRATTFYRCQLPAFYGLGQHHPVHG